MLVPPVPYSESPLRSTDDLDKFFDAVKEYVEIQLDILQRIKGHPEYNHIAERLTQGERVVKKAYLAGKV